MAWVEVGVHKLFLVATESFPLTLGYKLATGKKKRKADNAYVCLSLIQVPVGVAFLTTPISYPKMTESPAP